MSLPELILASQSPRRRELLGGTGISFRVVVMPTDEAHDASMSPQELCLLNAREKAAVVFAEHPDCMVIGADTLVFIDGVPLGKPRDLHEAKEMLARLSGSIHEVCTGVVVCSPSGNDEFAVTTKVVFKVLGECEIARYLELVHVLDKAGAYAYQEHGEMIVDHIEGSPTNVIGLPMEKVTDYLNSRGYVINDFDSL